MDVLTFNAPKFGFGRERLTFTVWPAAVRITPAEKGTVKVSPPGTWYVRVNAGAGRLPSITMGMRSP
jgi:hypothetical protein